jgi:hypothetical protein
LLPVVGGQLLAYIYCGSSDSGVQVMRLDPDSGKVVWRTRCPGLGVTHSKYHHRATVTVEGDRVRVMSHGSAGDFEDVLDLASGQRRRRSE